MMDQDPIDTDAARESRAKRLEKTVERLLSREEAEQAPKSLRELTDREAAAGHESRPKLRFKKPND